jgi:hypothetical protein
MSNTDPSRFNAAPAAGEYPVGYETETFDLNSQVCRPEDVGIPSIFESGDTAHVAAIVTIDGAKGSVLHAAVVNMEQPDGTRFRVLWGMDQSQEGTLRARSGDDSWVHLVPNEPVVVGRKHATSPGTIDIWGGRAPADVSRQHAAVALVDDKLSVAHLSQTTQTYTKVWGAKGNNETDVSTGYVVGSAEATSTSDLEAASISETTKAFESGGYMKEAPRFIDQVNDPESERLRRGSTVRHNFADPNGNKTNVSSTEAGELAKLQKILSNTRSTIEARAATQGETEKLNELRKTLEEFDELAFIGKPELDEAVDGIAGYWADKLKADPRTTITVLAATREDMGGSFDYMYKRVVNAISELGDVSDAEKADFASRIKFSRRFDPAMLQDPDAKFMFLDDWSISERSLKNHSLSILNNVSEGDQAALLNRSEVNLVFAFPEQIEEGIKLGEVAQPVAVKGYFKARHGYFDGNVHVTGTHASVDYGFEMPLRSLIADVHGTARASELLKLNGSQMPSSWWRGAYGSQPKFQQLLLFDSQRSYASHRNR